MARGFHYKRRKAGSCGGSCCDNGGLRCRCKGKFAQEVIIAGHRALVAGDFWQRALEPRGMSKYGGARAVGD